MRKYSWQFLGVLAAPVILLLLVVDDPCSILSDNDDVQGYCAVFGYRIYHFQTLITGIIAIFVAWATIYQMRQSDKEQAERHAAAREIGIRKDALKVQKVYDPFWNDLVESEAVFRALNAQLRSSERTEEKLQKIMNDQGIGRAARSTASFVKSEQINDIEDLLSPNASLAVQNIANLITRVDDFVDDIKRCQEYEAKGQGRVAFVDRVYGYEFEWGESLESFLVQVQDGIEIIINELSGLHREYRRYWNK